MSTGKSKNKQGNKKNKNTHIFEKTKASSSNAVSIRDNDQDNGDDEKVKLTKESIELNKYVLDNVNLWITNADNKIDMAFAIMSGVLAIIVFIVEDCLSKLEVTSVDEKTYNTFISIVILSIVLFVASIVFYSLCIIPRLKYDKEEKNEYSIFYDRIRNFKSWKEYYDICKDVSVEAFNKEIVKEIYFNSGICSRKMKYFRIAIILSLLSIISTGGAAFLYYCAIR